MSSYGTFATSSNGPHFEQNWFTDPDGTVTYSRIDSLISLATTRDWTRSGTVTPGYRGSTKGRKARGIDLPMNPFLFSLNEQSGAIGTMYHADINTVSGARSESLNSGFWGRNIPSIAPSSDVFAELDAKGRNKLLGKLHDQSVSLGIALAEGKQTINLFVNNIGKLAGSFRQLKRGDLSGAASILTGKKSANFSTRGPFTGRGKNRTTEEALASNWLELQYGWKPLLSDIYGACEFLANRLNRYPRYKEVSYQFKGENFSVTSEDADNRYVDSYETLHTCKYVLYYSQDEGQHDLSALGLVNPLAVAWELVPYSFVVDWALPIGTFLGNLDATVGLNFVKGCKTTFWRGTVTRVRQGKSYTDGVRQIINSGKVTEVSRKVSVVRAPLLSFPNAPAPRLKNPFSQYNGLLDPGDHALNALALLTTTFRGGGAPRGISRG